MSGLTRPRLADKPTTEVCTWIDAAPAEVWGLVSDIELMTTLSDELYAVEWIAPATGPHLGAAFRGDNRNGSAQWSSTSYIVDYEPEHVFAWATSDVANPGAIWRFSLEPQRGGTQLTQWVQMGTGQSGVSAAIRAYPDREQSIVAARLRQFERGMAHNVAALKRIAEGSAA
jgi:hypothetical protein